MVSNGSIHYPPSTLHLAFRPANVIHNLLFAIVAVAANRGTLEKFPGAASQVFHNPFFAIVHRSHSARKPLLRQCSPLLLQIITGGLTI